MTSFTIVEQHGCHYDEVDYEAFKKDFLDVTVRVPELKKKYDLSPSDWRHLRDRVCEDTGLTRKPYAIISGNPHVRIVGEYNDMTFIRPHKNGRFRVQKTKGSRNLYCGTYRDLDTAKKVRDVLVKANWDEDTVRQMRELYGRSKWNTAESDAIKIYPKFKEAYFNSPLTIKEVQKSLGIRRSVYLFLLRMIKEEYGIRYRPHRNYRGDFQL